MVGGGLKTRIASRGLVARRWRSGAASLPHSVVGRPSTMCQSLFSLLVQTYAFACRWLRLASPSYPPGSNYRVLSLQARMESTPLDQLSSRTRSRHTDRRTDLRIQGNYRKRNVIWIEFPFTHTPAVSFPVRQVFVFESKIIRFPLFTQCRSNKTFFAIT